MPKLLSKANKMSSSSQTIHHSTPCKTTSSTAGIVEKVWHHPQPATPTLAVLSAAPYPVEIPHPRRHTLSIGAFSFTLAREMSATTVYSENVLVPMKWNTCFPLQVKREVLSGSRPWPCVILQGGSMGEEMTSFHVHVMKLNCYNTS